MTRDPNAETRAELRRWIEAHQSLRKFLDEHGFPNKDTEPRLRERANELARTASEFNPGWDVLVNNMLPSLLDEIEAAQRFISHLGPICWKCQVLEERGFCLCEIAANE